MRRTSFGSIVDLDNDLNYRAVALEPPRTTRIFHGSGTFICSNVKE
jgi:hypothetical protein